MKPHLVLVDKRVEILLTKWTMLYLRCHFLKFLENDDKIYTIWGEKLVFRTSRHRRVVMLRIIDQ